MEHSDKAPETLLEYSRDPVGVLNQLHRRLEVALILHPGEHRSIDADSFEELGTSIENLRSDPYQAHKERQYSAALNRISSMLKQYEGALKQVGLDPADDAGVPEHGVGSVRKVQEAVRELRGHVDLWTVSQLENRSLDGISAVMKRVWAYQNELSELLPRWKEPAPTAGSAGSEAISHTTENRLSFAQAYPRSHSLMDLMTCRLLNHESYSSLISDRLWGAIASMKHDMRFASRQSLSPDRITATQAEVLEAASPYFTKNPLQVSITDENARGFVTSLSSVLQLQPLMHVKSDDWWSGKGTLAEQTLAQIADCISEACNIAEGKITEAQVDKAATDLLRLYTIEGDPQPMRYTPSDQGNERDDHTHSGNSDSGSEKCGCCVCCGIF